MRTHAHRQALWIYVHCQLSPEMYDAAAADLVPGPAGHNATLAASTSSRAFFYVLEEPARSQVLARRRPEKLRFRRPYMYPLDPALSEDLGRTSLTIHQAPYDAEGFASTGAARRLTI